MTKLNVLYSDDCNPGIALSTPISDKMRSELYGKVLAYGSVGVLISLLTDLDDGIEWQIETDGAGLWELQEAIDADGGSFPGFDHPWLRGLITDLNRICQ